MKVDITSLIGNLKTDERHAVRDSIRRAVACLRLPNSGEVSVVFSSTNQIHKLNKKFRHKNKPTTVLTFPSIKIARIKSLVVQMKQLIKKNTLLHYGEIFISRTEVKKYAKQSKLTYINALRYLIVHSFLHCLSYSHEKHSQTEKMEKLTQKILDN